MEEYCYDCYDDGNNDGDFLAPALPHSLYHVILCLRQESQGAEEEPAEKKEVEEEAQPDPLTQLITALSRGAQEQQNALPEDALYISYAEIMSQVNTDCRPCLPIHICREIGWEYGCTPVFLKIWTQSFQKVRKSWCERMWVRCQWSRS